jgi:D-inositol-3-phosphate glycosyltransferase
MNVLLVAHYLLPHSGGIEVLVDREARLLAKAGHNIVVLVSDAGEGEQPCYPETVRVCRVPAWNGLERFQVPWPVFSPRLATLLWQQVRWCDLVHAHGLLYLNSFLALSFARMLGKSTLVTEHSGLGWYPPGLCKFLQRASMETLGRASARLAGRCIGFHEPVLALLRRLAGSRGCVLDLPNPPNQDLFYPPSETERCKARKELGWADGRPKVLFVGRVIPRKVDLLLAARDPRYDLVFCGRKDSSVIENEGQNGVYYLPPRSQAELVPLYHAADVLALPSRSEGALPLVVQEALTCGLPVLLGEFPGCSRYRRCAGIHFSALTPDSVRGTLLEILQHKQDSTTADSEKVRLGRFLPDEETWLRKLYG